jgi:hypothetical protein
MMVRTAFLAAVFLISVGGDSSAQRGTLIGQGIASCEVWNEARRTGSGTAHLSAQWVAGYLSGRNVEARAHDYLHGADYHALMAWIDDYCKTNPRDFIATAASNLVEELQTHAQKR